jgi:hypothetical protein
VRVLPGTYTVRFSIGEKKFEQKITVLELPPDRLGRIR